MPTVDEEIDFTKVESAPKIEDVSSLPSDIIEDAGIDEMSSKQKGIYIGLIILFTVGIFVVLRLFYFVPKGEPVNPDSIITIPPVPASGQPLK